MERQDMPRLAGMVLAIVACGALSGEEIQKIYKWGAQGRTLAR